ncbi:3-dehydroquinate synthase [Nesterenkonia alkaliphila]|uniref:3-dehydroquinate synthase n=1 Tax=Nesterenkonia alkaliphila TaxID=1463631 RepID=A0A7K1UKS4_9MICC|nr:3-dehydroquinate synthase [Nesterenkonia alkaliphila]MVT27088.1 3-dehydroquinate synthase [Nesterenkonia alkaliphila]GFZ89012.1 3-dehydroquinate synthase [Nesterenkonia alkaliphila]
MSESASEGSAAAAAEPTVITVGQGNGTGGPELGYGVVVGNGLLARLPELVGAQAERVLVIHPRALRATGDVVREDLEKAGYQAVTAEIPDAEEGKHIQVAAFCWQVLGQNDFTRTDAVVAVGGGAVTDLAGFVAATWLRGIRVVHMPTTLLGMVDAAVGGKTGINTAEGKNLVGSFHQPAGVLADLDTLATLPRNELVAGLAEVVKCGFIADERILEIIEENPEAAQTPESAELRELIERAIRVKASVVGQDVREAGLRESLNYGHTLGHAIEHAERYQWRHGAAVSVGMIFAAELARSLGRLSDGDADRHREVLTSLGLPVSYRDDRWNQLLEGIRRDKKNRGETLRFVLLSGIGKPATVEIPDPSILFATYQEIAEPASPTISL